MEDIVDDYKIKRLKSSKKEKKSKKDKKDKKKKSKKKEKKDKKRRKEGRSSRERSKKSKGSKKASRRSRSRSRSKSKGRSKRELVHLENEKRRTEFEEMESKKYDMDPSKEYNQDWNQSKHENGNKGDDEDAIPEPEQYTQIIKGLEYQVYKDHKRTIKIAKNNSGIPVMIEVIANDRLGRKVRVKCCPDDTVGDLKKLISAHTGTRADKIRLQKSNSVFMDHITLADYEIHHGSSIDMYYN